MAQPYVGEIRMFAGNFAPVGWAFCNGQLLPISENEVLFQLIGTTYGGDGQETFAVPDLQGRVPVHQGSANGWTVQMGEQSGVESVTLTTQQIPNHTHAMLASSATGTQLSPANAVLAESANVQIYLQGSDPSMNMNAGAVTPVGGSQPHENMQPFLAINFIISLFGIFPSPT